MPQQQYKTAWWLVVVILVIFAASVCSASTLYPSYTYNFWGEEIPAPQAYLPTVSYSDFGGPLRRPRDVFVSDSGIIYIADTENHRIVRMADDGTLMPAITEFVHHGEVDRFSNPSGVFVTQGEHLFVADRGNARIVEFDAEGHFVRALGTPTTDTPGILPDDFRFRPIRVAVDQLGRIFAISADTFDGIVSLGSEGEFRGFIGAPRVVPTLADAFWRRIATEEQLEALALFLPIEYNSLRIDHYGIGMLYVTEGDTVHEESVKLLNAAGNDVLRRPEEGRGIIGDLSTRHATDDRPASRFVSITPRPYGGFTVLDERRGRIFTYNDQGALLYVFGGLGDTLGRFRNPVAIAEREHTLYVLDETSLTVFRPTAYANHIHKAIAAYHHGQYDESIQHWLEVLRHNPAFEYANTAVGLGLMRDRYYPEAMQYFADAQDRSNYSAAFAHNRREIAAEWFSVIMSGVLAIIVLFMISLRLNLWHRFVGQPFARFLNRREGSVLTVNLRAIWYGTHVIFHPFDGFWDIKHERRATKTSGTIILALTIISYLIMRQSTAFVLNPRDISRLNVTLEILSILVPFGLWCIINWAFTTLMEGKGTLTDIYISSAYALLPIVLSNLAMTGLSHFMTLEEGTFYHLGIFTAVVWSIALLIVASMTIHEYDMLHTVGASGLTVVGMGTALFLVLLFSIIIDELIQYGRSLYVEILFRL